MNKHLSFIIGLVILGYSSTGTACPQVAGLPDVNCDGRAKVAIVGDSVVYGVGDTVNHGKGGYVMRAAKSFPGATFFNLGKPGAETRAITNDIQHAFYGDDVQGWAVSLSESDTIVLDIGRNDWWRGGSALTSWRNLKRLREAIQTNVETVTGYRPFVVTAQLIGANRFGQAAWVLELNKLIAARSTPSAPGDLLFNGLDKRLLIDRVHPTSIGYGRLAEILVQYLHEPLHSYIKLFRKDEDQDGLYDEYEQERFGTSPTNPDSDGDGLLDGIDPQPTKRILRRR